MAHAPWFMVLMVTSFGSLWLISRGSKHIVNRTSLLVGVAILLRLPFLGMAPTLSDDTVRYRWDGRVLAAGENPYLYPPEAERLAFLRDEAWETMPHHQVETVYPPLAEGLFALSAAFSRDFRLWKLILLFGDLLGCFLLVRIARLRGVALSRVIWWAWNPLVILEGVGMGHVDILGTSAVIAAVWALSTRRPSLVAVAGAVGALLKLAPLAALPMWSRQSGRPWRVMILAGSLVALALAPVIWSVGGVPPGLTTYAVEWEYNGPIYEPLWRLLSVAEVVPAVKSGLDGLKDLTGWHDVWNQFYPMVYPQILAKLMLGLVALAVVAWSWTMRDPVRGTLFLFGGLLLSMATLYPWYLLWVLPWAALTRHRAWLAASFLCLLSYLPQIYSGELFPWIYGVEWIPFFLLLLAGASGREEGLGDC